MQSAWWALLHLKLKTSLHVLLFPFYRWERWVQEKVSYGCCCFLLEWVEMMLGDSMSPGSPKSFSKIDTRNLNFWVIKYTQMELQQIKSNWLPRVVISIYAKLILLVVWGGDSGPGTGRLVGPRVSGHCLTPYILSQNFILVPDWCFTNVGLMGWWLNTSMRWESKAKQC